MSGMSDGPMTAMAAFAASRHGVIGVAEATKLGVSRSRLRTAIARGDWTRPAQGVLVATAAPATWLQLAMIAVIASGGVLSHRAAARLHGLDGFEDACVEVTVAANCSWRMPGVVVHRARPIDRGDVLEVDGIAVTSIARTLVDLGSVVDDDLLEQALDDALRKGASLRWIEHTLERERRPGPGGGRALRQLLARPDRQGPVADSVFERKIERICVDSGLRAPQRQIDVRDSERNLVGVIDLGWPDRRLGIECHSLRWHAGAVRGERDRVRDNRLTALGWELIYATWRDTDHPEAFVRDVSEAFHRRSPDSRD